MKKVLITGKNSYVGRSFIERYQFDGMSINEISVHGNDWKNVDFSEYDTIFHVAAVVHQKQRANTLEVYRKVNRDLPFEIAKKAKIEGVKQFVFMSSIAIFGKTGKISGIEVINEKTPIRPTTFYGETKAEAEVKLKTLSDDAFTITVLRPPMVYGKGSPGNYQSLSELALRLPVLPGVKNQRSMIYIGNLVEFIYQVIDQRVGGSFSPQNDEFVDTNQMMKIIREIHGKKTIILPFGLFMVKLGSHVTGLMNKFYGNLIIEKIVMPHGYKQKENLKSSLEKTER